jgi:hypothetical protein
MPRLLIDNFETTLGAAIASTGATSLTLATGQGARLAALTLSAANFLPLTITNGTDVETVHATARTTDVLTIVRAREGTTALTFPSGSFVACYPTVTSLADLPRLITPVHFLGQAAVPSQLPDAGTLALWARSRAGRMMLEMMGPNGIDVALQASLFDNSVQMWGPSGGTTVSPGIGTSWTARNTGTGAAQSHPARATTNRATKMSKAQFSTGTTATGVIGIQSALETAFRGDAAGEGGVFWFSRFAMGASESTLQKLLGLSALNALLAGEPSAQNNTLALGFDSTDTNYQVISRSASAASKIDTGIAKTTTGVVFDFTIFMIPNAGAVTVRLVNRNTGAVVLDNVAVTANLPVATAFMFSHAQIRSTVGTTAKTLWLNRIYAESDIT